MLNELLEYDQYTDKRYNPRLSSELITKYNKKNNTKEDKCSGIPRALIVIARHDLDRYGYWDTTDKDVKKRQEIRKKTIECLSNWCLEEKKNIRIKEIENKSLAEIEELISDNEESIKNKCNSWASGDIYSPLSWTTANVMAPNFSRVISLAIAEGPLKEFRLSCKSSFFKDLYDHRISGTYKQKDNTNAQFFIRTKKTSITTLPKFNRTGTNKGKIDKDSLDQYIRFLKLIAAYKLTSYKIYNNSEPVILDIPAVANWMDHDPFFTASHPEDYLFRDSDKDELIPIFEKDEYKRWKMNESFAEKYDFRIEEAKEKEKKNRYYVYDLKEGLKYPKYTDFIKE